MQGRLEQASRSQLGAVAKVQVFVSFDVAHYTSKLLTFSQITQIAARTDTSPYASTKTCTFLHNKKAALTSGFSSIDNKKGDRPKGRSPLLILVLFVLGASLDLLEHLGHKLVNAHLNGLVGAIADGDVAGLDLLLTQDEHVGHAVDAAGLADLVADLLVAIVADHANAGLLQLGAHLVGVVATLLRDGKRLDLHGGQPGGKLARKVLDQNTDKALDGAKAHAVQHDGALLGAVGVHVLQVKVERHLEVELHGAALPGTAERVLQVEVDLGAVPSFSRAVRRPSSARAQSSSEPMESSGRVESSTWYLKPNFWYTESMRLTTPTISSVS